MEGGTFERGEGGAAMVLKSDKGQLAARLEQEQQERQVLTAAARNDKTH